MSLKRKLFTAVSMFALTCAMLLVGVWAVSSTSIEVGGTISFQATSVNAEVTGAFSGASTNPTLNKLTYSSTTSPSTTDLNSWKNNVTFAENGADITLTINVTNKSSERAMYVSIEDTAEDVATLTKTIKQGANDYTEGNAVKVEASATVTFTVTFHLTSTDVSTEATYAYTVTLKDESEHVELMYDSTNEYWYVEMGNYEGTAVRWRYISSDGITAYTSTEKPNTQTGSKGWFLQEVGTTVCDFGDYYWDEENQEAYANNDYATSAIRQYITGTDCALTWDGQDMTVTGNYLNELGITENNAVYKKIQAREVSDLYKKINWDANTKISDGSTTVTGADKLWLLSVAEMYSLLGGGDVSTITASDKWSTEIKEKIEWSYGDGAFWLRSPKLDESTQVYLGWLGEGRSYYVGYYNPFSVRPAFILEF